MGDHDYLLKCLLRIRRNYLGMIVINLSLVYSLLIVTPNLFLWPLLTHFTHSYSIYIYRTLSACSFIFQRSSYVSYIRIVSCYFFSSILHNLATTWISLSCRKLWNMSDECCNINYNDSVQWMKLGLHQWCDTVIHVSI